MTVLLSLLVFVFVAFVLVVGLPVLLGVLAARGRGPVRAVLAVLAVGAALLVWRLQPTTVGWLLAGLAVLLVLPRLRVPRGRHLALPRPAGRKGPRVDPDAVGGIWSRLLRDAVAAREQFVASGRRAPTGAISERLADLRADVDHGLAQAWDRARRGWELEGAAAGIAAASRAHRPRARWGRGWFIGPDEVRDPRVLEAQRSRDQAAARLGAAIAEERAQLQVLVARLVEAACSAAELSVAGTGVLAAAPDPDRSRELVDRLTALRAALTEATTHSRAA